ncbi:hypothetical protein [Microbacterium algeriense]|uniref:hypothetical protein n=1 Tax=Microbacterium algeriense TaxID=2615184 RepID=UPI0022E31D19|nr:hypothetical protein [Microbacterium algeriense]
MTANYEELVSTLSEAADRAARMLTAASGHPDVSLGAEHLRAVVDRLADLDVDLPEQPSPTASLSVSAAEANQVHGNMLDRISGIPDELEQLELAVAQVTDAGYRAPAPDYLDWYNDDTTPQDGTSHD